MGHELICEWLGLPAESWPPDHYRLLGLEPGESDPELIEQRVHQRLDSVRHYQMTHPELATEAMNRLAQAYVCLTDSASKQPYDAALLGGAAPAAAMTAVAEVRKAPSNTPDPLAWLFGPATSAHQSPTATPPPLPRLPSLPPAQPQTLAPAAEPEPPEPVDPLVAAARDSKPARRGLATKRALYRRVVATRNLLRVWEEMGTYVESPTRRLSRSVDGPELNRLLRETTVALRRFPPLMGAAGQPGYLVVMLLRQDDAGRSFRELDPGQRTALSRDWQAGRKLLTAHRDFLRQEVRAMRKRTVRERMARAAYAVVADQPAVLFLALLALALGVALWRSLAGPH